MATVADQPLAPASDTPVEAAAKPGRAKKLLPALLAVAALGGAGVWALGRGKETTDDAFVEGRVASVAPRVVAPVKNVLVKDNQVVKAGDVLVELDDRDYQVRVRAAKADLAAAKASLRAAQTQSNVTEASVASNLSVAKGGVAQASAVAGTTLASIEQAKADILAAEARAKLARSEFERSDKLFGQGAVSKADFDAKSAAQDQAEAALTQARSRLIAAQANVSNSAGTVESARGRLLAANAGPEQVEAAKAQVELASARVEQAQAALDQAELNLSYTKIVAPTDGAIARRNVEVGQLVSPDRPLFAIVPTNDVWVVANFKEDQIAEMREGQKVEVDVDAFPGRAFSAHVESLAAGTGSRFSLLPPDNASGNFTKVVQRVPVLIRFDGDVGATLRPGMSVKTVVRTK